MFAYNDFEEDLFVEMTLSKVPAQPLTSEPQSYRIAATAVTELIGAALRETQVRQAGHLVLDVVVLVKKVLQSIQDGILRQKAEQFFL